MCKTGRIPIPRPRYTQAKKKRPFFMVLYLSIQLRCPHKIIPKCFPNARHTNIGNCLIFSSYPGGLCEKQLFPSSKASQSSKRDKYVTLVTLNDSHERQKTKKKKKN